MAKHNELGKLGESLAAEFLERKGYHILEKNWRSGRAEIDLIAYVDQQLIFVEVKTRSSTNFGFPEEFVTDAKQTLISLAGTAYIELMNHQGEIRFDIVSVLFDHNKKYTLNHIEDAFWSS